MDDLIYLSHFQAPRGVPVSNSIEFDGIRMQPLPVSLLRLNEIAITLMRTLLASPGLKRLKP